MHCSYMDQQSFNAKNLHQYFFCDQVTRVYLSWLILGRLYFLFSCFLENINSSSIWNNAMGADFSQQLGYWCTCKYAQWLDDTIRPDRSGRQPSRAVDIDIHSRDRQTDRLVVLRWLSARSSLPSPLSWEQKAKMCKERTALNGGELSSCNKVGTFFSK